MKPSNVVGSALACCCLTFSTTLLAAQLEAPATATVSSAADTDGSPIKSGFKCLADLSNFSKAISDDGFWLGGSGFAYGYPIVGPEYAYPPSAPGGVPPAKVNEAPTDARRNIDARPSYEIRTLMTTAGILARHGSQQTCEDVLATTRDIYKVYVKDMHDGGERVVDVPAWRRHEIGAAQAISTQDASIRSDELLGSDVFNQKNVDLGSVTDLITSPSTGSIAYLVIGRGGIFGIDEKYVAVPWADFKTTPNVSLLVLDATTDDMNAAPQVKDNQLTKADDFKTMGRKIDTFWQSRLSTKDVDSH